MLIKSAQKVLLKNVQDDISRPLGSREIGENKERLYGRKSLDGLRLSISLSMPQASSYPTFKNDKSVKEAPAYYRSFLDGLHK